MKSMLSPLVLLAAVALMVGCGSPEETATAADVEKSVTEKVVQPGSSMAYVADIGIEGMTCSMGCAKTIESKVSKMDGVVACTVDFEGKTAHIEYDHAVVSEDEVISTIGGIADGQYKVTTVNIEKPVEADAGTSGTEAVEKEESDINVRQAPSFSLPNIFNLFSRLYSL